MVYDWLNKPGLHRASHTPYAEDDPLAHYGEYPLHGIETYPSALATGTLAPASGEVEFVYCSSPIDVTISAIEFTNTVAPTTLTLARVGLYTVDTTGSATDGALTLVAASADIHSTFAGTGQQDILLTLAGDLATAQLAYTLAAPRPPLILNRYAVALIQVGTTPATLISHLFGSSFMSSVLKPTKVKRLTAQTDLPTSVAAGSLGNTTTRPYFRLF